MNSNSNICISCGSKAESKNLNNIAYFVCDSCGLLWRTNFTLPKDHYLKKDLGLSGSKKYLRKQNSKKRLDAIADYMSFNNLCDIGTGDGILLDVASEIGYSNLIGLEPAEEISKSEGGQVIIQGDTGDLSTVFKKYDVQNVSMFHVIEHLPDPEKVLKTIYESLPTGGSLVVETPDSESYMMIKTDYNHDLVYEEHFFLFTTRSLVRLLNKVGFRVVKVGRRDFNPPLSMRESLIRLGIIRYNKDKDRMNMSTPVAVTAGAAIIKGQDGIFRGVVRRTLYKLVKIIGHEDYIWIVAKK